MKVFSPIAACVVAVAAFFCSLQAARAQTVVAAPASGAASPVRIALADVAADPTLSADAASVRAAMLARLRLAFGSAAIVDGAAPSDATVIRATLARASGGFDLALMVAEPGASSPTGQHFHLADPSAPVPATQLVALVDRAGAPRALATPVPVVALAPLAAPADLRDTAVAATALLATRLRDATGATVDVITEPAGNGAVPAIPADARVSVIGGLARSGTAVDLHLAAYAADRAPVGDLHVTIRDIATFPAPAVFTSFLESSIDAAPVPESSAPVDVVVLPFASSPDLADAAAIARTAFLDRLLAGGIAARAAATAGGATSFAGTLAKTSAGYHLGIVGTSGTTGGSVTTSADLSAPALVPSVDAVRALVDAAKNAQASNGRHLVFVPFENPSAEDGYIAFANSQFAKVLGERGYAGRHDRGSIRSTRV